ncbi:NAD(P)-dependent oxidoreductase [Peptoniphilus equinus]|uniref:NAD(P)-dependent oxidoreductase n=1 Tax=Peptoniphilus equinus TaxID=3016343 RepID=A0ABY7QUL1_9FIRM|nr:NAD(P)-dependent oxidoreductase [Peptoniphilus equinus]WBW50412.1 NAD(P)-dependent oxidoreductase [Peptoniphilus equinus]
MKLFITSRIPQSILDNIKTLNLDMDYEDSNIPLSASELARRMVDADILLCPLSDKITKEMMSQAPNLKLIANYGAGFDNIDIEGAKELGIAVTNAPAPSSAVSTAELTFLLILASVRRLIEGEKDLRDGGFMGWRPTYFLGEELRGKTLGIIGMGNIGKNLAKRAIAFDMEVIYYSRHRKEDVEALGAVYKEQDEVIAEADILTLHTAFAPELRHMIGSKELALMKDTAHLINAARGPLVDEAALIDALERGKIRSAALDVYEFEPKVSEALLKLDNVTLAPHLGNATLEARMEMGEAVVNNIRDFLEGKKPRNEVTK